MTSAFVSIVNYRTAALVVAGLRALATEIDALQGGIVVVVDNASGDGSAEHIADAIRANGWSQWAELLALAHNGGFAYGNNRALQRIQELDPHFTAVVFLNPDTTVRPGAVGQLLEYLRSHNQIGVVGPAIEDESGLVQRSAHIFPSPLTELAEGCQLGVASRFLGLTHPSHLDPDQSYEADWVSGACFAVRREVFERIGNLDEGYFLYFEEVDFCRRARQAGWSCWYVADARIVHREGSATGICDLVRRRPSYWFASRRRYFNRAYGLLGLVGADLFWVIGRLSFVARRAIGLGGHPKQKLPARYACDLLIGDAKAIVQGELGGAPARAL